MICNIILGIFGWRFLGIVDDDDRPAVLLFVHTHITDFIWIWISSLSISRECKGIAKESLWNHWLLGWLMPFSPFLSAPRLHSTQTHSTQTGGNVSKWATRLRESKNLFLAISPKGTRMKSKWKTGWKHIALEAGVKVRVIHMDWDKKVLFIGKAIDPTSEQEIFQAYWDQTAFNCDCHENPFNTEIQKGESVNWELFCPFDACLLSLLLLIPHVVGLFCKGHMFGFSLSLSAVLVSFYYHSQREVVTFLLGRAEAWLAGLNMAYTTFLAVQSSGFHILCDSSVLVPFMVGCFTYLSITPRHEKGVMTKWRGRYCIFHPLIHFCVALVANRLTQHVNENHA